MTNKESRARVETLAAFAAEAARATIAGLINVSTGADPLVLQLGVVCIALTGVAGMATFVFDRFEGGVDIP